MARNLLFLSMGKALGSSRKRPETRGPHTGRTIKWKEMKMKHLCRISLVVALLAVGASGAYAQDPSAGSPAPQATPVVETAPAPVAPAPEAAPQPPVAQPENPPATEPSAPSSVQQAPAPDMSVSPQEPAKPAVKTKKTTRVVEKQRAEKVAPAPKTEADPATAAAAAIAASGTTGSNPPPPADGGPPPAETAANPAPPPPAEPLASTASEAETKTEVRHGGPWVLIGVLVAAGVGIYLLMSRRRRAESLSIFDREVSPTVERVTTPTVKTTSRPGPPITHNP
jgi:hypothetical protein